MALKTPYPNDSKPYGFEWLRVAHELDLQEGVLASTDFRTTAAAAGGMRVDVAAGTAAIKGDSGVAAAGLSQGLYIAVNDAAIPNAVTLGGSNATLPRVDQIVLTVNDTSDLGSASDALTLTAVPGTPTSGATLDNRNGAQALPANAIRLADVLVPAASSAVSAGNVRDRRPWARGASAYWRSTPGGDYATGSGVESLLVALRAECSGAPIRLTATASMAAVAVPLGLRLAVKIDGTIAPSGVSAAVQRGAAGDETPMSVNINVVPVPGSHVFSLHYGGTAGATTNVYNTADLAPQFSFAENLAGFASLNG